METRYKQQSTTTEPKSGTQYTMVENRDRYNLSSLKNFVPEIRYTSFKIMIFSILNMVLYNIYQHDPLPIIPSLLKRTTLQIELNMHYQHAFF